jgi:hypothetical protein
MPEEVKIADKKAAHEERNQQRLQRPVGDESGAQLVRPEEVRIGWRHGRCEIRSLNGDALGSPRFDRVDRFLPDPWSVA